MLALEYDKYITTITTAADIDNHAKNGYSRLLDPHGVTLLFSSLRRSGHPNILPCRTLTDAFDDRRAGGVFPDNRLTVRSRDDDGG